MARKSPTHKAKHSRRPRKTHRRKRNHRRTHKRGGGGLISAAKTALVPFLLFTSQKRQQRRTHKRRTGRKSRK